MSIEEPLYQEITKEKLEQMGIQTVNCRNCGREIIFMKTKAGKLMPVTLNLESHFIDCPGAAKFRRRDNFNRNRQFHTRDIEGSLDR